MKLIKISLPKQIANEIEQQILDGVYNIGDKIPTEPELVSIYGASRNTIREAIQSLINGGLLEARQGLGTYVIAQKKLQVEFFNSLKRTNKYEVEEVRNFLEEYIIISAIEHRTDKDLIEIEKALLNRKNDTNKIKENTDADIEFHRAIALATHNSLLIDMYQYISQFFNDFIAQKISNENINNTYIDKLHDDLFNSIKNRDKENAKKIIEEIINL